MAYCSGNTQGGPIESKPLSVYHTFVKCGPVFNTQWHIYHSLNLQQSDH